MRHPEPAVSAPEQAVLDWIERVVVGLDLCPFASRPLAAGSIRTLIAPGDTESVLTTVADELASLVAQDRAAHPTTMILLCQSDGAPGIARDFEDYLDLIDMAEGLIEALGYEGRVQIASFHPDYLFADADADDPANWSNRSPVPLVHLLREDAVTAALEFHEDPEGIPQRNIERLRALGIEGIRRVSGESR